MAMTENLRPALLFWYGQLLALCKLEDRALAAYRQVTRENPRHQQAWSSVACILVERGDHAGAIAAFEAAAALAPNDAGTQFNLGFVRQQLGQHEDAMRYFTQAIALDPNVDRAWYGLGLSLAHLERYAEAAGKFAEAARLQPMNPFAGYQLASVWHKLGEHDKVRAEYHRVKGFDPKVSERIRVEFGVSDRHSGP